MSESLVRLLKKIPTVNTDGNKRKTYVSAIVSQISQVQKDCLYVAIDGQIDEALKFGAKVIVSQAERPEELLLGQAVFIQVKNVNETLSKLWAAWYSYPSRKIRVIGVTGSLGKTATCNIINKIFNSAGKKAGVLDTTNLKAQDIQSSLAEMVRQGFKYAILEIPLQAILEWRISGVKFDVAVFTNLNRNDVLIRKDIIKIFNDVTMSVVNRDDASWESIKDASKEALVRTYSFRQDAYCRAKNIIYRNGIFEFNLILERYTHKFSTPKAGDYNISNILAAVTAARFYSVNWEKVIEAVLGVV